MYITNIYTHHGQRHPVDFMLVFRLVLAEGRVAFEQFVEHTAEAEPVGTRVVGRSFRQHFGRHVSVRAPAITQRKEKQINKIQKQNKAKV